MNFGLLKIKTIPRVVLVGSGASILRGSPRIDFLLATFNGVYAKAFGETKYIGHDTLLSQDALWIAGLGELSS